MNKIGNIILEALKGNPDVTFARDASTSTLSGKPDENIVRCRCEGADYDIVISRCY